MNRPLICDSRKCNFYLFSPSDYYTIWTRKLGGSVPDSVTVETQCLCLCLCLCLCCGYRRSGKWGCGLGAGAGVAVETVYSKSTDPANRLQHVALHSVTSAAKGEAQSVKLHTWPLYSLKHITWKLLWTGLRTSP